MIVVDVCRVGAWTVVNLVCQDCVVVFGFVSQEVLFVMLILLVHHHVCLYCGHSI
jgi:hypothetical protein